MDAASARLNDAELPFGARTADAKIMQPAELPACDPLDTATSNWFIPDTTPELISAYLSAHPSAPLVYQGSGSSSSSGAIAVRDIVESSTSDNPRLLYTFAQDGNGVDLRVDAQVVPRGARCVRSQTQPGG